MATTLANISIKDSSSWNTYLYLIYPVGSYYLANTATSPGSRFGGTWAQIKDQRFLCGYSSITSGGKNDVTLDTTQIPSHGHTWTMNAAYVGWSGISPGRVWICADRAMWNNGGKPTVYTQINTDDGDRIVGLTGGGKSHENRPLFRTCYMWYRTA